MDLDRQVESILLTCRQQINAIHGPDCPDLMPPPCPDSHQEFNNTLPEPSLSVSFPKSCTPLLVQRCPTCFGGNSFGQPLCDSADIHVTTDSNFHYRHHRSSGDSPFFYEPIYFLPKAQVDTVGQRIEKACKHPARNRQTLALDEVVDQCESSYEAVHGKKKNLDGNL